MDSPPHSPTKSHNVSFYEAGQTDPQSPTRTPKGIVSAIGQKISEQAQPQVSNFNTIGTGAATSSRISSKLSSSREVKLLFMDDFCKQAKIFTNRDDSLKHQIDHSRKLHKVYEKSLENATKNFRAHPEVHGMDDFLKPLPRLEDVASEKRHAILPKPSVVLPKKSAPAMTGRSPTLRQPHSPAKLR